MAAGAGGSFTTAVQEMFGSLAGRYDSFNHWASLGLDFGWRRAAVRVREKGLIERGKAGRPRKSDG